MEKVSVRFGGRHAFPPKCRVGEVGEGRFPEYLRAGIGRCRPGARRKHARRKMAATIPVRIAGMKPAGLIARNSASFSTPARRSTGRNRYGNWLAGDGRTSPISPR